MTIMLRKKHDLKYPKYFMLKYPNYKVFNEWILIILRN